MKRYEVEAVIRFSAENQAEAEDRVDAIYEILTNRGESFSYGDVEQQDDEDDD